MKDSCQYENFILDIYEQPDFAHDVLKFITEKILAPWIQVMKKECPKAKLFRGADAMASMPLVNLHILKEFIVPYIMMLKDLCGGQGEVFGTRSDIRHQADAFGKNELDLGVDRKERVVQRLLILKIGQVAQCDQLRWMGMKDQIVFTKW